SAAYIVPGADGEHVFTDQGIFPKAVRLDPFRPNQRPEPALVFPAAHGDYYLRLAAPDQRTGKVRVQGTIHQLGMTGPGEAIPNLGTLSMPSNFQQRSDAATDIDKRLLLLPEAKVLVVLPESDDRVVVQRISLPATGR